MFFRWWQHVSVRHKHFQTFSDPSGQCWGLIRGLVVDQVLQVLLEISPYPPHQLRSLTLLVILGVGISPRMMIRLEEVSGLDLKGPVSQVLMCKDPILSPHIRLRGL